ncbi:MAG: enolase C-terminal domain-like protein [Planctomycetaceae bacterium]
MKIHRLTAFHVPIRLKNPVRHASHERSANDTLIVRCVMDDGSTGWGEGLPRTYVTGESIESAWNLLQTSSFEQLRDATFTSAVQAAWHLHHSPFLRVQESLHASAGAGPAGPLRECFGNSVRCAVELAILDAACRSEGVSLGDLIPSLIRQPEWRFPATRATDDVSLLLSSREVFYSGAVTSMSPRKQWLSALKMRLFAFRQVKVKVGAAGIPDRDILRRVRRVVGRSVDLRLDANEAWQCDEVKAKLEPLLDYGPTSLEQPVPHGQIAGLAQVRREVSIPIMLDESLCCLEDAQRAVGGGWCDLFNIRLSKCGGLVRSLELAAFARQHSLGYQLGCQVGETGILSAAGRHFACNVGHIRYLEGSFDRFLVTDALTEQDLTFRYGGRGARLTGPGLGVDVNECRIREIALRTHDLICPDRPEAR